MTVQLNEHEHRWILDHGEAVCATCGAVDDEQYVDDHGVADSERTKGLTGVGHAVLPAPRDHHADDRKLIKRIQQKSSFNLKDVGKEGRLLSLIDLFSGDSSWVEELKDDLRVQLQEAGISAGVIAAQLKRLDKKLEAIQEDFKAEVVGAFQPYFKEAMKRKVLYALRPKEDSR